MEDTLKMCIKIIQLYQDTQIIIARIDISVVFHVIHRGKSMEEIERLPQEDEQRMSMPFYPRSLNQLIWKSCFRNSGQKNIGTRGPGERYVK